MDRIGCMVKNTSAKNDVDLSYSLDRLRRIDVALDKSDTGISFFFFFKKLVALRIYIDTDNLCRACFFGDKRVETVDRPHASDIGKRFSANFFSDEVSIRDWFSA